MTGLSGGTEAEAFYGTSYTAVHRRGLQGWGNSLTDRQVEKLAIRRQGQTVMELGASSGEHLNFIATRPDWQSYVALDLLPAVTDPALAARLARSAHVRFVSGDVSRMPFATDAFDLVISTCLFAHLRDPEAALVETRRVVRPGGQIVIGLPCDPGMLNRAVKLVVTYPRLRRAGVGDPRLKYAREHVNPVGSLLALASHVFRGDRVRVRYHPFRVPSWNANLLATIDVKVRG
ncbi:MAG: putative ubiquinone/menaquinone biosynthesis methyltransferase [Nocardioides sp.]|jgi:SAM-dependent methyltransferase|uniref:class I SAM-dependent methyltransferase n=1 Tax=Nocardioides sp. TaxID=35761 RepID=UPI0026260013|nr:class I SAM-dependent methyltransferase [Nocardioides sp.]MCW2832605.1 putative ubiquinone/menaquinone biosynthesis methyltransferase [Nocardioides sp.]